MTPDQRTLAIWGGGLAAGLIIGYIVLDVVRGETHRENAMLAAGLGKEYQELYPESGMAIAEATGKWQRAKEFQQAALLDAEKSMVPELPREYLETDLNSGAARVHADHQFLKQKAQRTQVRIPAPLPLERGLSENANERLMQLAQLYLYRNLIDTCMEAGVTKINSIKPDSGPCDPQGKYALILCSIELETTWNHTSQLLADLNQSQNRKGYGVRSVTIEHDRAGNEKVSLVISLMTANNPAWKLLPDSAPRTLPGGQPSEKPATGTGGRSRFDLGEAERL